MDTQKQQLLEKLKSSTNILVTVSANPSVDQLAACIGLTLLLNKIDKHATAVFSGDVPSTIDFLKPEDTLEKTTDSLRDFIIALDKSKADKLRYKVEDKIVKIFITPYRTSLTSDDLDFSQGDFNVDMVVALGVHQQGDLDQAITAHGRILHDAAVACINNTPEGGDLGTLNWQEVSASSLSELVTELSKDLGKQLLDEQIATALLTGIVAETDRFRNEKTSSVTMNLSGDLMAAGANQQLVADQLEHSFAVRDTAATTETPREAEATADADEQMPDINVASDGTLEINHEALAAGDTPEPAAEETPADAPAQSATDTEPAAEEAAPDSPEPAAEHPESRSLITEAPSFTGSLTANSTPEHEMPDAALDSLGIHDNKQPLLDHDQSSASSAPEEAGLVTPTEPVTPIEMPAPETPPQPVVSDSFGTSSDTLQRSEEPNIPAPSSIPEPSFTPPSPPPAPSVFAPTPTSEPEAPEPAPSPAPDVTASAPTPTPSFEPAHHETLTELEAAVDSPHAAAGASTEAADVESARNAVLQALNEQEPTTPEPIAALNAQPLDLGQPTPPAPPEPSAPSFGQPSLPPLPPEAPGVMPTQPPQINQPDQPPFANSPADQPLTMPTPPGITLPPPQTPPSPPSNDDPNAPPPVPPPMMPPFPQ